MLKLFKFFQSKKQLLIEIEELKFLLTLSRKSRRKINIIEISANAIKEDFLPDDRVKREIWWQMYEQAEKALKIESLKLGDKIYYKGSLFIVNPIEETIEKG